MTLVAVGAAAAACALAFRPPLRRLGPVRAAVAKERGLPPLPVVAASGAAVAALLGVPMPLGLFGGLVAGVLVWRAVRGLEPSAVRRQRTRLEATLPQVVDLMSTCLEAGASETGALVEIADALGPPMAAELTSFVARLQLGADPVTVWAAMATHPQLGPLGRALRRAGDSGSSVSEALARLAVDQRSERRAAVEAKARTIEVSASLPLGLCLLPAFVLIGIVPMVASSFSLTLRGL